MRGGIRSVVVAGVTAAVLAGIGGLPAAAAPSGEPAYANGQTFWMHSTHLAAGPGAGLLAAPPMFVMGYPVPAGTSGPITLPSGYQPQCDPCAEENPPYHDHVLTGAPGFGLGGTAGSYEGPWRLVVMRYSSTYAYSDSFIPITSDEQIPAAEAAGDFAVINPGAADPYQIWTPLVLICPLVTAG
jgi:hypothetical protein